MKWQNQLGIQTPIFEISLRVQHVHHELPSHDLLLHGLPSLNDHHHDHHDHHDLLMSGQ